MAPSRRPLGEATSRVNNSQDRQPASKNNKPSLIPLPRPESRRQGSHLQHTNHVHTPTLSKKEMTTTKNVSVNRDISGAVRRPCLSPVFDDYQVADTKRESKVSKTSTAYYKEPKAYVGPWELGKSLGEGATAHVRLARYLGDPDPKKLAAVKIVKKKDARLSQAGSLAALDHLEAKKDGSRNSHRMPLGIEREVAIMKLTNHPNIMELYDIWENSDNIYLVMEFVGGGELFEYITSRGNLREKEAMKFWRQILSAVGYCHTFNICHRDLKPENILLTGDGNIKIADFGMAALRQTDNHWLNTSCGSPHYAAPEVISGSRYLGHKVDIWSMGVILYAMLAGTLPFDHPGPGLAGLLALVKKGKFSMSPHFGSQARDLIARILRLDPQERLTVREIWRHPLLQRYDYLDNLSVAYQDISNPEEECGPRMRHLSDIDPQLLRHLRSMWHTFDEEKLIRCLLSDKPNEQRRFYHLILNFKAKELENYHPELGYSSSDYHHAHRPRPLSQIRKLSTRQFSQPTQDGQGQIISCFTVVGNGKKDPSEPSHDSLKRMKPQNLEIPVATNLHVSKVRTSNPDRKFSNQQPTETGLIVVPRHALHDSTVGSESSSSNNRGARAPTRRGFHTRSSLASSTVSRAAQPAAVKPNIGHKRGIGFSRQQRPSSMDVRVSSMAETSSKPFFDSEAGDQVSELVHKGGRNISSRYIRSKKSPRNSNGGLQPLLRRKSNRISRLFEDDVRQISVSLEQDCEMAFNKKAFDRAASLRVADKGSEIRTNNNISSFQQDDPAIESSPRLPHNLQAKSGNAWWDRRPLPRPPARSESVNIALAEARRHAEYRRATENMKGKPGYLDQMVDHIDHLMQPTSPSRHTGDRRARSAPVPKKAGVSRGLASIEETSLDGSRSDVESQALPKITLTRLDERPTRRDGKLFDGGIRIVSPSSSPVKAPAPLRIRKQAPKNSQRAMMTGGLGADSRQQRGSLDANGRKAYGAKPIIAEELSNMDGFEDTDEVYDENSNGTVRRKGTWFKRSSKSNDEVRSIPDSAQPAIEGVKKMVLGFGTLFKKRASRENPKMEIVFDAEDSISDDGMYPSFQDSRAARDLSARQIEPQQSWIAKLFKVKPVKKHICCRVSRVRARKEVLAVFKSWKSHGLTDIVVDKERNLIFARVVEKNTLDVKPLSFAAEVLTVIEHGNRHSFSIVRLTQERGAASTLTSLADKLGDTLLARGLIVTDPAKAAMMVQTANTLR